MKRLLVSLVILGSIQLGAEPLFDGWKRFSEYVAVRDGTRLAVDYYRPTRDGELHKQPLPVVWEHTPYHRFKTDAAGQIDSTGLGPTAEGARTLLENGYIFASADVRGHGASFGNVEIWIGPQQGRDAHDITEWLAAQSWSTGNIGMSGRSYLGTVQYFAAAEAPPHLKAIFAEMGGFDNYRIFFTNGIYRSDLAQAWRIRAEQQDHASPVVDRGLRPLGVAPVDADPDGRLLTEAVAEHAANADLPSMISGLRFRDDFDKERRIQPHLLASPWSLLEQIEASRIPIFHRAGWFDLYVLDALLFMANLSNTQKLVIGPWYHRERFWFDEEKARLDWFDYWLKEKSNGVLAAPRIRYTVIGDGKTWQQTDTWPPVDVKKVSLKLKSDTGKTSETLIVDYDFSLGTTLERNNGLWDRRRSECGGKRVTDWCYAESGYPDHTKSHQPQLIYQTDQMEDNLTIVGQAQAELWVSANVEDFDVFAILEEVTPEGNVQHVAQAGLRASHRTINTSPYNNLGVPWHGNFRSDASRHTGQPTRLTLIFPPVANRFDKHNRIRLTITGADIGSHTPSAPAKNTRLSIHRGQQTPSTLVLPATPTRKVPELIHLDG